MTFRQIPYQTEDGPTRIECRLEGETLWLTQSLIADFFEVAVPTINEHLKRLVADVETEAATTLRSFRLVRSEDARQVACEIQHYSLPAALAICCIAAFAARLSGRRRVQVADKCESRGITGRP